VGSWLYCAVSDVTSEAHQMQAYRTDPRPITATFGWLEECRSDSRM